MARGLDITVGSVHNGVMVRVATAPIDSYPDVGCKLYPKCLECPRERCIHDDLSDKVRQQKIKKLIGALTNDSEKGKSKRGRPIRRLIL